MKKNFVSLAYLQNYRRLNIITRAISTNPNPHFGKFDNKFLQRVTEYPACKSFILM